MTQDIATLHPVEAVQFDHAILAALCDSEGERAEETITAVLSDVEGLINIIATQHDHPTGLARSCADLSYISGRIGMITIRDAADAVLTCIAQGNGTALAACMARLIRLGEPRQTGGWAMEPSRDSSA